MSASKNAFSTASPGMPPKTNAETSTPVSTTTLILFRVGLSPDRLDSLVDVLHRQAGIFERLARDPESRIEPVLGRKHREDIILRVYFLGNRPHLTPLIFLFIYINPFPFSIVINKTKDREPITPPASPV